MESLFLVTGILVFAAGMCLTAVAFIIPYRLVGEINDLSPADQRTDTFPRISEAMWRRHRELFPDSPKRRQMTVAAVAAVLMMFAGVCLLSDYGSLHDLSRNRAVAPRQQSTTGTVTGGPAGRNRYSYTFAVGGISYSDWGSISGPEPKLGQQIPVYYDPLDPSVNALGRFEYSSRQFDWDLGFGLFALIFVTVVIIVSVFIARGHRNQSAEP